MLKVSENRVGTVAGETTKDIQGSSRHTETKRWLWPELRENVDLNLTEPQGATEYFTSSDKVMAEGTRALAPGV